LPAAIGSQFNVYAVKPEKRRTGTQ